MRTNAETVETVGTAGPVVDTSLPAPRRWPEATGAVPTFDRTRILVVGAPAEAENFGAALATMGHDVVAVHNAQAAISVARQWPVEIVFIDVDALVADLSRFADRIREIAGCESTHVVALTEHHARYVGFSAHMLKPLALDTAEQLISSLQRG